MDDSTTLIKDFTQLARLAVKGQQRDAYVFVRRLAKRYSIVPSRYDDRQFRVKGDGTPPVVFDHVSSKPERVAEHAEFFEGIDPSAGECVIGFGWAMAEDLDKLA